MDRKKVVSKFKRGLINGINFVEDTKIEAKYNLAEVRDNFYQWLYDDNEVDEDEQEKTKIVEALRNVNYDNNDNIPWYSRETNIKISNNLLMTLLLVINRNLHDYPTAQGKELKHQIVKQIIEQDPKAYEHFESLIE
jgi:hypothetical protein